MVKRGMIFGSYDTAAQGWTLTSWKLTPGARVENRVTVPGAVDGPRDYATALTGGEPRYGNATLTATFETSEGTRLEREAQIRTFVNWVDGWRQNIILPDAPGYYLTGEISVVKDYNDLAHAAVTVTGICAPWLYAETETAVTLTGTAAAQTANLTNAGRRTVVPLLVITGGGSMLLEFGAASWALGAGSYQLPDLVLPQGVHALTYSGEGMTCVITYREAVLPS